jgi:hypothetical protein
MKKAILLFIILNIFSCAQIDYSLIAQFGENCDTPNAVMSKIHKNIKQTTSKELFGIDGVYVTPDKTIEKKEGNCVAQTILFLAICEYKRWGKGQAYWLYDYHNYSHMAALLNNSIYDCNINYNPVLIKNKVNYENSKADIPNNLSIVQTYDYDYMIKKAEADTAVWVKW